MILNSEINEFDVIIVGGGATGAEVTVQENISLLLRNSSIE